MILFKMISVKNFLGYGEIPIEIRLDESGTTLITGKNGVGKTSVINAIVYTLYGRPISNGASKKDNLVNNINKKGMETKLEFTKDGVKYLIHRARKLKTGAAGTFVHIYKEGKDITPDSINNGNQLIENIIGIPYELFIRIATVSATYVPFLDLPVKSTNGANQTDIIEELFNLKLLTTKANSLKEQIKETKHALDIQHAKKEALESEKERHERQLETANDRLDKWDIRRKRELQELNSKLEAATAIDVVHEEEVLKEIESLEIDMKDYLPLKRALKESIRETEKSLTTTERELSHLDDGNCPYCHQEMADVKDKIVSAKMVIDHCNKKIAKSKDSMRKIVSDIQEIEDAIAELESKSSCASITDLYDTKGKIEKYKEMLESMIAENNPHIDTIEELKAVKVEGFDIDSINDLDDLMKHQKLVLSLLSKKDSFVRKNLINKNIPYLNNRLNHYLLELELNQVIQFKFDMSATVSLFGRSLDFSNLSNGQKARVNLAMSFAFRDVLQNLHGQMNICMLDEVLDVGLDGEGTAAAVKMLRMKGQEDGISVYIISHKEELQNVFEKTIRIAMVDDFSTLEYLSNS